MKKLITLLGSLMIIAGLKAQKEPAIKKETTAAVKTTGLDSMKSKSLPGKQQPANTIITKQSPPDSNKIPSKISPVVKPEKHNPVALPMKESPVTKPTKQ